MRFRQGGVSECHGRVVTGRVVDRIEEYAVDRQDPVGVALDERNPGQRLAPSVGRQDLVRDLRQTLQPSLDRLIYGEIARARPYQFGGQVPPGEAGDGPGQFAP